MRRTQKHLSDKWNRRLLVWLAKGRGEALKNDRLLRILQWMRWEDSNTVHCSFLAFGGVRKKKGLDAIWNGEGVSLTQYEVLIRVSSIPCPHTEVRLYLSKLLIPLLHTLSVLHYSKLSFCLLYHSEFMYFIF